MRVLAVGKTDPAGHSNATWREAWRAAVTRLAEAGDEVQVLCPELRARGDQSLRRALAVERSAVRVLEERLRELRPDVVVWWDMTGLPVSLIECVRRLQVPALALVHDDWVAEVRAADQWHARRRYRHPRVSAVLERVGVPASVDLDRAARYLFGSDAALRRARLAGLALPDAAVAAPTGETLAAELRSAAERPLRAPVPARPVRISVVIPTLGRAEILEQTLAALGLQTLPTERFEVLVVEDAKSDAPPDAIAGIARSRGARALKATTPGASAARNLGWEEATGDVVLFTGDDMIASRRLLEEHAKWHEANPEDWAGVLGHVVWSPAIPVTPFMRWLEHGTQFEFGGINGTEATFGHFYTSNVSVKRAALAQVGGFDADRFPFLYEDLDLGYRLSERGFRLLYNRRAVVEHHHHITLDGYRERMKAVARSEVAWTTLHPDQPAHNRDRLARAAARPPYRGRATHLLRFVRPHTPFVGPRVWRNATLYYRQQLAPAFLAGWDEAVRPTRERSAAR